MLHHPGQSLSWVRKVAYFEDTYNRVSLTPSTDTELVRTQTGHHEHEEMHLHLNPEPSPDPADPLNFPQWRKIAILLLMGLYAFTANLSSSVISSALPDLVTAFAHFGRGPPTGLVPFSSLTHLIAVNNLMLGASNIWWVPLGNTFGRRPVILLCLLILTACSIWCGEAKSFNSLLIGRIFQGTYKVTSSDALR